MWEWLSLGSRKTKRFSFLLCCCEFSKSSCIVRVMIWKNTYKIKRKYQVRKITLKSRVHWLRFCTTTHTSQRKRRLGGNMSSPFSDFPWMVEWEIVAIFFFTLVCIFQLSYDWHALFLWAEKENHHQKRPMKRSLPQCCTALSVPVATQQNKEVWGSRLLLPHSWEIIWPVWGTWYLCVSSASWIHQVIRSERQRDKIRVTGAGQVREGGWNKKLQSKGCSLLQGLKGPPAFCKLGPAESVGASGWMRGALWWSRGVNAAIFAFAEPNARSTSQIRMFSNCCVLAD